MKNNTCSTKRTALIFAASLAALFVMANLTYFPVAADACPFSYGLGIPVRETAGKTEEQVSKLLLQQWFARHEGAFSCPFYRITDYRIDDFETYPDPAGAFQIAATYDVRVAPIPLFSLWENAGEGPPDHQDGWIRGHTLYLHVKDDGPGFYIASGEYHAG